jgi:hypothetical protein
MKKCALRAIIVLIIAVFVASISTMALADDMPPPPAPPGDPDATPVPPSGGGGGGGSTYTPPAFQPYVEPLASSDGSIVGNLTVKDYSTVLLWASKNTSIGNVSYDLSLAEELNQKPAGCRMDLSILPVDKAGLPVGMQGAEVLGKVSIAKDYTYGWSLKSGTQHIVLNIMGLDPEEEHPDDVYYCVRFDGSDYIIQNISAPGRTDNGLRIELMPTADDGTFTFVMMKPGLPTATPAPVPSVTVEPVIASPVPVSPESGQFTDSLTFLVIIFTVGNILGMAIMLFVFKIFNF